MRKGILANYDEPTDTELSELMLEVVADVKKKALISRNQLAETVEQEIKKAQEKFKVKYI